VIKILITSIGSTGSQNVIKGLRSQKKYDIQIIGVDACKDVAAKYFVDIFHQIPLAYDEEAYLSNLTGICEGENINLLIPIMEPELEVLSKCKQEFGKNTILLVSDYTTITTCNDKKRMHTFFEIHRIPTPQIYEFEKVEFPVIVKPINGTGTKNVYRVDNYEELNFYAKDGMIIQQFIEGDEYTIDTFSDFDGRFIGAVPRKRLEVKGGLSTKSITIHDEELISWAKTIVEKLQIVGPANLQCIRSQDGLFFIEVNPRFGGAYILSIKAGLNAPLFLLDLISGQKVEYKGFKANLLMLRYWEEIFCEQKDADIF
jgi:carbamoyl-phosphate synthase large subunit